jgi:hypothetical protein
LTSAHQADVNDLSVGYYGSGTLTVSSGTHTAGNRLYVGRYSDQTNTVHLQDGELNLSGGTGLAIVGYSGTGTMTHTGGKLVTGGLTLGNQQIGDGTYNFSGGTIAANSYETVGLHGNARFEQSGSTTNTTPLLRVGYGDTSYAVYELHEDPGTLNTQTTTVGVEGRGYFLLHGGTHKTEQLEIATGASSVGQYILYGGTLEVTGSITSPDSSTSYLTFSGGELVGTWDQMDVSYLTVHKNNAEATFDVGSGKQITCEWTDLQEGATMHLGDSQHTVDSFIRIGHDYDGDGVYTIAGGTLTGPASDLMVRTSDVAEGRLQGWGTVDMPSATFRQNGFVVADGEGAERTLSINCAGVVNTEENTAGYGWFAQDGGRLQLPAVPVEAGDNACVWAESPTDMDIDLVNSVRLEFTGLSAADDLVVALLDSARSEVPIGLLDPVGVWEFDMAAAFDSADMTFRYDHELTAALGIAEAELKVFQFHNSRWADITSSIDMGSHWAHANGVDSFSYFAVATGIVPEPVSAVLLATGLLAVAATGRCRRNA